MVIAGDGECMKVIADLNDSIMKDGKVPKDWEKRLQGRGTTDAIFILWQLQKILHAKNKNLYFAFVNLDKAFDRVPCQVLW